MKFMSKEEFQRLEALCLEAVRRAEESTTGEIVPAFVHRADVYPVAHYRAGLTLGLFLGALCVSLFTWAPLPLPLPLHELLGISMALGLILGHLLAYADSVKRWFITGRDKRFEVRQRAIECFHDLGVHATPGRNGVLLFIAEMERRIEILADLGLKDKVQNTEWDQIEEALARELRAGRMASGLVQAIEDIGRLLARHFPRVTPGPRQAHENALADHLQGQEGPSQN